MNKIHIIYALTLSSFLIGCGGGGSSSPQTTTSTTKAFLIDAPVWGAKYINSDGSTGTTAKDGSFDYKSGTTSFYVGKVKIGEINSLSSDNKIFIQDFFSDVNRGEINNSKVLKVATFLQSLDSQPNNDNIIEISSDTSDSFFKISSDISLNETSDTISNILLQGGFSTKEQTKVKEHLINSLSNNGIKPINVTTTLNSSNNITSELPSSLKATYGTYFNRYTKVQAPNGKAIHILAQKTLTDEQIIRARSILEHYLKDYKGSLYGNDKSAVANKMADNGAKLLLLDGSDGGTNKVPQLEGQPLYKNELQVEGGDWYINQNYEHRDGAYEEILHLVHDTGIGVDGKNSQPGALPNFQKEIRAAQNYALTNKIWGLNSPSWIQELTEENSLSQEYLASLIDAYYGLWGAWQENTTTSMWGEYTPRDREEINTEDKLGDKLLDNKFFHPYITYNARIDKDFKGDFSLKFNSKLLYTYHSRYLKDITLLGTNNTNIVVNELSNDLTGNNGINTVIFSGTSTEYTITINNGIATISDNIDNRDGKNNVLKNMEKIRFIDKTIDL